jgi:hypothetical protein
MSLSTDKCVWLAGCLFVLSGCGDDLPPLVRAELTISEQPLYPSEIVDDELIVVVGTAPVIDIKVFDDTGAERTDTEATWSSVGPAEIARLATESSTGLHGKFVVLGAVVGGTQLEAIDDLVVNVEVRAQIWPIDE